MKKRRTGRDRQHEDQKHSCCCVIATELGVRHDRTTVSHIFGYERDVFGPGPRQETLQRLHLRQGFTRGICVCELHLELGQAERCTRFHFLVRVYFKHNARVTSDSDLSVCMGLALRPAVLRSHGSHTGRHQWWSQYCRARSHQQQLWLGHQVQCRRKCAETAA